MFADPHARPAVATPRVVTGLDGSPASAAVLAVARRVAAAIGAELDVVHVGASAPASLRALVADAARDLVVEPGDPATVLAERLAGRDAVLAVVGCRGRPQGPRPAGHVSLELVQRAATPVVVVPPDATPRVEPLRDVLLPLDGTRPTALAADPVVALFAAAAPQVTVVHVFDADTAPRFLDHTHHAVDAWGREFLARHSDDDNLLVLRSGPPGAELLEVIHELEPDLVVLAWGQDLAPGRARTIRHLLHHSPVPLLLVPADGPVDAATRPTAAATVGHQPAGGTP